MNQQEYAQWCNDITQALLMRYSTEECAKIVDWMGNIKGAAERDLVGHDVVEHLCAIAEGETKWDLYRSMTMRAWLYAPYILAGEYYE